MKKTEYKETGELGIPQVSRSLSRASHLLSPGSRLLYSVSRILSPVFHPLYSIPSNSLKKELLFALINLVAITGLRDYP